VSVAAFEPRMLLDPVTLGVVLGLLVGKQIGVFGLVLAAVKLGMAQRPAHANWGQIYGVSLLCGVGFTMSLFIGPLAFADAPALEVEVKVGVLAGSIACMLTKARRTIVSRRHRPRCREPRAHQRAVEQDVVATGCEAVERVGHRRPEHES
jgi:NhaA family Na+:H+ antiporter